MARPKFGTSFEQQRIQQEQQRAIEKFSGEQAEKGITSDPSMVAPGGTGFSRFSTRGGRGDSGSSGVGGQTSTAQQEAQKLKEQQEIKTRTDLANLTREFNQEIRNIQGISGRTERLKQFNEDKRNISQRIEKPQSVVREAQKPEGILAQRLQEIRRRREELIQRGKPELGRIEKPSIVAERLILGIEQPVVSTLFFGKQLVTKPVQTTTALVGGALKVVTGKADLQPGKIGRALREEPTTILGGAVGEVATGFALGGVIRKVGGRIVELSTRLDPKFKPLSPETSIITGLETSKGIKEIGVTGRLSSISEPISEQAKLAGKKVDAVSGQRSLFGLRDKVVVDKPLPSPDAPQLERSFFADPRGRLRPSRLGLDESDSAGVLDVLAGDVSLKRTRPQALLFPDTQIERFPSALANVERKLKLGQSLTPSEQARLLEFQQKPSGQFKPVGFLSKEPEVTLPVSEIIVRKKTAGITIINGRRVPIFETEIKQATKETSELLQKLEKQIITKEELSKLSTKLSKETGIDYSYLKSKKVVSPTVLGGAGISLLSTSQQSSSPISSPSSLSSGPSAPSVISPAPSGQPSNIFLEDGFSPLSPSPSAPSPISPAPSQRVPSPRPPTPPVPTVLPSSSPFLSAISKISRKAQGYDVGVIHRGKERIIGKSLNRNDALDVGAKRTLDSLRATFFIRKSNQPARDIPDTNVFQNNRQFFRKPFPNSKLNDLGEETWIQKKMKIGGRGSRLGSKSEVQEINLFQKIKGKKNKNIWDF